MACFAGLGLQQLANGIREFDTTDSCCLQA